MEQKQTEIPAATTSSAEKFDSAEFFRKHLVKAEDGSYAVKGDDLGNVELALLETEKRRRGSQAASSREKARADKYELEIGKVKETIHTVQTSTTIDPQLKYDDPDEYIRLTLEAKTADPYQKVFDEASQYAAAEVGNLTMENVLATHNQTYPNQQITADMLEMDLPPRLMNEFTSGTLSPSSFLKQASDILYRPTETANQTIPVTPDLGAVGGQTTPTDDGSNDKLMANYASAIM